MASIAYVNGVFLNTDNAMISINDRGVQFGDAIYEVWGFKNCKLLDESGHFTRLERSLSELSINNIFKPNILKIIFRELMRRNRIKDGIIYLQISRGTQLRDHAYEKNLIPNIIITARPKNFGKLNERALKGFSIKTTQDIRWGRVDIKTTNLLPNVIAKQNALDEGFDDVWFIDNNQNITEGSAQNAWIITFDDEIITRPLSNNILSGITRASVIELIKRLGLKFIEREFSLSELENAKEAFITSATSFVTPIISVNNISINNGQIGEISQKLRSEYLH
jgi:D-alanine transaminase